ncbi:MAG TPA: nucleotidyltransferase family protein [Nitrosopumilaceae archaeon]|nr:nucleotidyltransferase family protein [Nitrosopumilaceae archaeon]
MKAVILAGGLGTRLQPYTTFMPKPMLPLGEKPLLEHLIDWNRKNGIKSIVLCVSYLRKTIEDYFETGKRFGVEIEYANANRPLATAGQLKTAEKFIDDTFVCMYGDSIFDFNLKKMITQHKQKKSFVTIGLFEFKTNLPYGVIETSKNGKVTSWNEKPEINANINMGCYVMEPGVFDFIPKNKPYGMDDLVRKIMVKNKPVQSFITKKGFIDIGDKTSYRKAYQQYLERLGNI